MPTVIRKYLSSRGKRIVLICKHCGKEFETLQLKANAGEEYKSLFDAQGNKLLLKLLKLLWTMTIKQEG